MPEQTPPSAVVVDGLERVFGDTRAVADVSFSVVRGAALGIVGESGSGKTTVARMLMGLLRPTSGSIQLAGVDRSAPPRTEGERRERAREIQMVFQDPYGSLDRRQTASAALTEVLRLHANLSRQQRDERVRELGDLVGLDKRRLDSLPRALSGGERQRVAIARALATGAPTIILDEAVAALDVSIQAQVLNVLRQIREATGVTYLLISHDLAVVRYLVDDVVVMKAGAIVERGTAAQVLASPEHAYTQQLRDSVPRPNWRPARRTREGAA